jgi:peptidylprolyl isomerase
MKSKLCVWFCILVLPVTLLSSCSGNSDRAAADGDAVAVHYTGTLEDGTQFDSSRDKDPLEFIIGAGQMIKGFDNAVRGMKKGEKKTVTLPPEEAYGPSRDELIVKMGRDQFPAGTQFAIGQQVPLATASGQQIAAEVVEVNAQFISLDANHELAGKTLKFEIELVSITPAVQ